MSAISSSISFLTAAYALQTHQKTAQATPPPTQSVQDSAHLSQEAIEALANGSPQSP
jgi:hypothetical protein